MKLKALITAMLVAAVAGNTHAELNPADWRYATDPHGSTATYSDPLVKQDEVAISFVRVPRVDAQNNSWVELIYDLPNQSLQGVDSVKLTYQSDKPLVIKLSQKQYGGDGDKSYAHYQTLLPSATDWQTLSVKLADFSRPDWTPQWSTDQGIVKDSVSALYFVPDLTDAEGGQAWIKIKAVELQ